MMEPRRGIQYNPTPVVDSASALSTAEVGKTVVGVAILTVVAVPVIGTVVGALAFLWPVVPVALAAGFFVGASNGSLAGKSETKEVKQ